jgi:predicted DNA-binding protein (MmcQ/YjbR family)
MPNDPMHDRLLAIVLRLPGTREDRPWGSVHCKVDDKIFVGWGRMESGEMSLGFRVSLDEQVELVENDPRFSVAKYVGRYGGVDMRVGKTPDWSEIERFIEGSYRIIASKKRVKELDAMSGGGSAKAPAPGPAKKKKASAVAKRGTPAARR